MKATIAVAALTALMLAPVDDPARAQTQPRVQVQPPTEVPALDGVAAVIDGGTLAIAGRHIRLYGINAPGEREICARGGRHWACGTEAAFALAHLVGRHWLHCVPRGPIPGPDKAVQAVCYLGDGRDVNAEMVREGWAFAARHDPNMPYAAEEAEARAARRGLWSADAARSP